MNGGGAPQKRDLFLKSEKGSWIKVDLLLLFNSVGKRVRERELNPQVFGGMTAISC